MKNLNKQEIHNIMQKIKHNEKEAVEELYQKYRELLISISFSIVKNNDIAEEITQSIFLKIIQMNTEQIPNNNELSWLYTITKNQSIDFLRKQKKDISLDEIYEIPDKNNKINDIINQDTYNKIIDSLSKKEKEIVSLKILAGLTFDEIGKLLNESTSTIKWRYYKAIYSLKLVLGNLGMAIVAFVIGFKTLFNKTKVNSEAVHIEDGSNNNYEDMVSIEQEISKSTESKNYDRIKETNTITNDATIQHEEINTNINYVGVTFLTVSAVFLITTIIFFIKYQLKLNKKSSK